MTWSFSIEEYCLLAALAVMLLSELYFYIRYIGGVLYVCEPEGEVQFPPVSVVVCARNEVDNLDMYLHRLLSQDYPEYEVIVVDDGSEDGSNEVIEAYIRQDKKIRKTFVPKDARLYSTKKLGLTLAAKAARYDYLLLTDADCCPESKYWIRSMMTGFASPEKEIVLGYGAYFREPGLLNTIIRFDTLFNGLHFLGAAVARRPYMGVGRNLAYKKELFFSSGGFAPLMTERSGDDDLLVNRVATRTNTAVVVSTDSVTWSLANTSLKDWLQQKRRHLSVSPRYTAGSKTRLTLEPLLRALFYGLLIAIAVLMGVRGWIIAASAYVLRLFVQLLMLNLGARKLGQPAVLLEVVWLDICLPLLSLYMLSTQPFYKKNMRW